MNPSFLDRVATHIKANRLHSAADVSDFRRRAEDTPPAAFFLKDFQDGDINMIAEIKYASPSQGVIRDEPVLMRSPEKIAAAYRQAGAKAVSILTEPHWFQGEIDYVKRVHTVMPDLPLLMKDFYIAEEQFYLARMAGASSVLLIAAMLSPSQYREFYDLACSLQLVPLTEVHDVDELEMASAINPALLGINNRNLKTLTVDLNTGIELRKRVPSSRRCVCESGIESAADIRKMAAAGFDAFLTGTRLMRTEDPGAALRELLTDASGV